MTLKMLHVLAPLLLVVSAVQCQELYPQTVQQIGLGGSVADVKRVFPEAKIDVKAPKVGNGLIFVFFPSEVIWDSAVFEIVKGRVASISLLRGVMKKEDAAQKRDWILDGALAKYGAKFSKRIALTSDKQPAPILVWNQEKTSTYLSIVTPTNQGSGDKEHVRLVIAPKEKDIHDLFELPTVVQDETARFDQLMGDTLRKRNIN